MRRVPRVDDLRQIGLSFDEPRDIYQGRAWSSESPSRFNLPRTRGQLESRVDSAMGRGAYDVPVLPPDDAEQGIRLTAFRRLSDSQAMGETSKPTFEDWDSIGEEYKKDFLKIHSKFLKEKGYEFISMIGQGAFGDVWLVKQRVDQVIEGGNVPKYQEIACKILSLKKVQTKRSDFQMALKTLISESEVYSLLNHPNIVSRVDIIHLKDLKSGFSQPIHVLMFMELMEGDLNELIYDPDDDNKRLTEDESLLWLRQVVSGLWYLHNKNICHLDLKPHNILYITFKERGLERYIFKLSDFGISAKFESDQNNQVLGLAGTPGYMAPELDPAEPCEAKPADIYSLGIIMAESIGGSRYSIHHVRQCARNYQDREEEISRTIKFSRPYADLLAMMLNGEPEERPTISQVRDYMRQYLPDYYESYYGVTRL